MLIIVSKCFRYYLPSAEAYLTEDHVDLSRVGSRGETLLATKASSVGHHALRGTVIGVAGTTTTEKAADASAATAATEETTKTTASAATTTEEVADLTLMLSTALGSGSTKS